MFGVSFLSPWFLLGALAVAGPIVLHLFARESAPVVTLPTARFVRRAPVEQVRRRHLQDVWLLLVRMAALCLLALAFARPFLAGAVGAVAPVTVVAIDGSYSMASEATVAAAKRRAQAAIENAPGGAQVALISFDEDARVLVAPTSNRAAAVEALAAWAPGFGGTSYGAALRAAREVIGDRDGRIVLVTDLQRAEAGAWPALPPGIELSVEAVPPAVENVAVERVAREAGGVSAVVRSTGLTDRRVRVRLLLDGREAAAQTVAIPAGQAAAVSFTRALPPRGTVAVAADDAGGLPADDARYLVLDPAPPLPVLVVTPVDGAGDEAFFVVKALESTGEKGAIAVEVCRADDRRLADPARVSQYRVVIVLGTRGLDRPAREALAAFPGERRGLWVVAGPDTEPGVMRELLGGGGWRLVEGEVESDPGAMTVADPRHPVMAALGGAVGTLGQIRTERAMRLVPPASASVLARFAGGAPALVDWTGEPGREPRRVLVSTTDVGRRWNTWPLHPTFVPFVVEGVRYLAGDPGVAESVIVGPAYGEASARPGVIEVGSPPRRVAVNVDPREARLDTWTADELLARVERLPEAAGGAAVQASIDAEARQGLWRAVLWALLVVLAVEAVGASRARRGAVSVGAAAGSTGEEAGGRA
jgi:hypothetical protein